MGKDFGLVIFRWFKCLVFHEYFLSLMQLYLFVPCNIHVVFEIEKLSNCMESNNRRGLKKNLFLTFA